MAGNGEGVQTQDIIKVSATSGLTQSGMTSALMSTHNVSGFTITQLISTRKRGQSCALMKWKKTIV